MNKKTVFKTISIVLLLISLFSLYLAIFFEDKGSFLDLSIVVQVPATVIAFICFILAVVLWKHSKKRET